MPAVSPPQAKTIHETVREAATRIPKDEATHLMRWVLNVRDAWLYTHGDSLMSDVEGNRFESAVRRRAEGEPIAYIEGRRGFWSMDLHVSPATLIPRVETERLVEAALSVLPRNTPLDVLDLGTGSGAIALAIARERPMARVVAVDRSSEALAVAQANAVACALGNVEFIESAWYSTLGGRRFHCIVTNPPYIPDADPHLQQGDLRFEPRSALAAGADGLDDIRCIVSGAAAHLQAEGCLLIEHGYDQGRAVRTLFENEGFLGVKTLQDLEARDRVTQGMRPAV